MFFDNDMSSQCGVVRKNHAVANFAIVRDMAISQKVSVVTDSSRVPFSCCPADSDEFSEDILVSDLQVSRFTDVFEILALLANRTIRIETVSGPDFGRSAKSGGGFFRHPPPRPAPLAQHDSRPNHKIRPNSYVGAHLSFGINDRRRVNVHCAT